jgi:hypothetical protein
VQKNSGKRDTRSKAQQGGKGKREGCPLQKVRVQPLLVFFPKFIQQCGFPFQYHVFNVETLIFATGLKFSLGQEVWLMNPRSSRQKVASGVISGLGGNDKFYFVVIQETWFKIGIKEIFASDVPLMWENATAEQFKVGDV